MKEFPIRADDADDPAFKFTRAVGVFERLLESVAEIQSQRFREVPRNVQAWETIRFASITDSKGEREYRKAELKRSLKYCKEVLGLGMR